jgi:chromosome segregation ATPase
MPTQEERLSNLERITALLQDRLNEGGISELNRDVTMLVGIASRQGSDIRELKAGQARIEGNLNVLERGLDRVEEHMGNMEQRLGEHTGHLKLIDAHLKVQDEKLDAQDKKLDQMLLLLTALAPKPEQGT